MRPDWMDKIALKTLNVVAVAIKHWPVSATVLISLVLYGIFGSSLSIGTSVVLVLFGLWFSKSILPPMEQMEAPQPQQRQQQQQHVQQQVQQQPQQQPQQKSWGSQQQSQTRSWGSQEHQQQFNLPGVSHFPAKEADTEAFNRIIGLEKAKETVKDALMTSLNADNEQVNKYSVRPPKGMLMYGPPGTGKTSFARAAAEHFGCTFYVVNASSIISGAVGGTEENIRELFQHAKQNQPSVIFFDEIDAIGQKRTGKSINSPSDLAINSLLTQLDGFEGSEGVFVLAATNRLDVLDDALTRSGRFDTKVEIGLPDSPAREKLFKLFVGSRPNNLTEKDYATLASYSEGFSPADIRAAVDKTALAASKENILIDRQMIQEAIKEVSGRGVQVTVREVAEIWAEIDSWVGLDSVRKALREVEAIAKANMERKKQGLAPLKQSLHMCFLGNPGTGKTMVARVTGELLAAIGALPSGHLVETDRSGLVAGYVGQTAEKTKKVIAKAMGGVLFIDEAYSLARGGANDFGPEALDTIIKDMEDSRDKLCVIFAGYSKEMQELFAMNSGLESRISFSFDFEDYSPEQLVAIAKMEAKKQSFSFDSDVEDYLASDFASVNTGEAGNGRYARKLIEGAIRKAVVAGRNTELAIEDFKE